MKVRNSLGLTFDFHENGSIKSIETSQLRISLRATTIFSRPGTNIYLRKRGVSSGYTPLLGPNRHQRFRIEDNTYLSTGLWAGLEYTCLLRLSGKSLSWQWTIDINNISGGTVELDLIYVQDVGLKSLTAGTINEYYVSQYIERRILEDKDYGSVICCRQNMKESLGNPWLMMACRNGAETASTDGMQFYGKTYRETGIPEGLIAACLPGECAGEYSVTALQEKPFRLSEKDKHRCVFIASCLPDHPQPTTEDDLKRLPLVMNEFAEEDPSLDIQKCAAPVLNLFNTTPSLPVDDLNNRENDSLFDKERRFHEKKDGMLLSFFCGQNNHVVLKAKETLVDRPHAHILQAKAGFTPDENIVSTTCFAYGVFNSHLAQGNTNFNVLLSVCTGPWNLMPETGQRIFIETDGQLFLLGIPSAFEMGLNHCRWIYKSGNNLFQVRTWTSHNAPQVNLDFKVIRGKKVRLLITHHFDELNGWTVTPGSITGTYQVKPSEKSMISHLFPQAQFSIVIRGNHSFFKACGNDVLFENGIAQAPPLFVVDVQETSAFYMSIVGEVCGTVNPLKIDEPDNQFSLDSQAAWSLWKRLCMNLDLKGTQEDIAVIREILPWYGMNALTHYLTPYGPEQFSGAAWGTRDIVQGPFDLLLYTEKYDEAKQVLCILFSNQNPDGGWPQWWMFDSYSHIRADGSHGDIYYWCIIALSNYLNTTGDLNILEEILPYYHEKGVLYAEKTPLSEHIERLIQMIIRYFIPGTALVPFDGGDWNDSLQPVNKDLAQRLISSWTVEMNYQAFNLYREIYELTGNTKKAAFLKGICEKIKADFNKFLVRDGVVAGYGLVEEDGSISVILHPSDTRTGIKYSILPMNRGIISEIFSKEQALYHQDLVEQHLKGPDGARLMDRPLVYKGGIQTMFQRAESSTYFGREIGLMYMHEHLRYTESLAIIGKADAFLKALRQAIPVAYNHVVTCGDNRQSNCYYSSSDVIFMNRYEADTHYNEIMTGKITLKGGWRVYSSGPGIFIGLIVTRLLGFRIRGGNIIIDPVMPPSMDGFTASLDLMNHPVTIHYFIKGAGVSPGAVYINGKAVAFTCEENQYRRGGAVIPVHRFLTMLNQTDNEIRIQL